jgi:hypothetical protein
MLTSDERNTMRTTLRILLLALLALATVLITSCAPSPVSISDRITMFVTSLNGNMKDTYTNMDPNAAQIANGTAKADTFWSAAFPQTRPLAIVTMNTNNPSAVTLQLSSNGSPYTPTYTLVMVNSPNMGSDNWLISQISWTTTIFN